MISRHADIANLLAVHRAPPELVAAAWLIDIHEDTKVPPGMLEHFFGASVTELVLAGSHYGHEGVKGANRDERMAMERDRIAMIGELPIGDKARTLKLAYLLVMARLIVRHEPRFAPTFMREMRQVLGLLIGGNSGLFLLLATEVENYFRPSLSEEEAPPTSQFGSLRSPGRYIQLVDSRLPLH